MSFVFYFFIILFKFVIFGRDVTVSPKSSFVFICKF